MAIKFLSTVQVDTDVLYVDASNNRVGIGTDSPSTKLHISDASTPEVRIQDTTNNRYLSLYQNNSNSYIQSSLNSALVLSTHGANERMRITTAGNVGIGTTSPGAKLDIVGGTSSDYAPLTSVSLTGETASGTGWAGTGVLTGYTHTPGNSAALVTTIVPSANTKYKVTYTISGITAGRFDFINFGGIPYSVYTSGNQTRTIYFRTENTDPLEIIAQSGTAGTITIDSIAVIGIRDSVINIRNSTNTIVNQISTGATANSVYIGNEAGQSLPGTTTLANTALGSRALKNNLNGGYNTAIGYNNIRDSFASSYITAVGHNIFPHLTKVGNVYNTAIGTNIGTSTAIAGSQNILLGNNIFMSATTANGNIAMGYNAMRDATTASKNIALGTSSLFSLLTGSGNIALGEYSLTNKTGGNYDLALGHLAGRYAGSSLSANTNSGNSIFLGYRSRPKEISETNQIVIGHDAIGNGSNSVTLGATTITKTILNGNVGIGTTSPGAKLEVRKGGTTAAQADTDLIVQDSIAASSTAQVQILGGATGFSNLYFSDTSAYNVGGFVYNHSSNYLATNVNGSERMRINSAGSVGIGTTNPGVKLDVNGQIRSNNEFLLQSGTTAIGSIRNISGALGIRSDSTRDVSLGSVTSPQALFIEGSNGNIGIGTTSPETITSTVSTLTLNGTSGTVSGGFAYQVNGTTKAYSYVQNNYLIHQAQSGVGQHWFADGSIKMAMLSSGNVGIGTTSPSQKLHVSGNAIVSGIGVGTTTVYSNSVNLNNSGTLRIGNAEFLAKASNDLSIYQGKIRIQQGGNVGIGTASPGAKLDVVQATTANGAAALHLIGPSTNPGLTSGVLIIEQSDGKKITMDGNDIDVSSGDLFINDYSGEDVTFGGQIKVKGLGNPVGDSYIANGNFGVGTTSPQEKLHVVEEVEGNTLIEVENTRGNSTAGVKLSSGQTNYNIAFTDEDGNFKIYNKATNRIEFYIGANGRVGIDTTNPAVGTKLDVAGKVKADNYINQRVAWNVGFNHGSNNTASYYFIPVGYLAETTADTYYNNWIAPYAGRVRKIVIRNTGTSTVPTATTVNFRVSVNGSVVYTGSTITVTGSGLNILASQTLSDTNAVFSATDRVQVAYRTNGLWRNAAAGISLEYTE